MKRKITQRYMLVFTVSVLLIIVLWVGLTYVLVVIDNKVDSGTPQYVATTFFKYIDEKNLTINKKGEEILKENNLWAQILDREGNVIDSFNVPSNAQFEYDIFKLSSFILDSDTMEGQTIYLYEFNNKQGYGVLIGCASSKVAKYNIQLFGGVQKRFLSSIIVLICIFVFIEVIAGFIFSKTISSPVQDIIAEINSLEADAFLEPRIYRKSLFSSVYDSLDKLQLRLKSADRERENAERQKNEWISNISHDMRTPLSSIKGYAEVMAEGKYEITKDERKQYAYIILKNSENIDNLIQELKFNRLLEDGMLSLNKEEVNINKLIQECCDELPAEYRDGRITYKFEKRVIYAEVDRQIIKRCFTNLVGNAFIHNNGDVNINIESYEEKGNVVVKISDDGKGMNGEEMDRIFERYYRGVESKSSAGSGLGLSIVKEIVEAHGGEITVESQEGGGTTFVLRL